MKQKPKGEAQVGKMKDGRGRVRAQGCSSSHLPGMKGITSTLGAEN